MFGFPFLKFGVEHRFAIYWNYSFSRIFFCPVLFSIFSKTICKHFGSSQHNTDPQESIAFIIYKRVMKSGQRNIAIILCIFFLPIALAAPLILGGSNLFRRGASRSLQIIKSLSSRDRSLSFRKNSINVIIPKPAFALAGGFFVGGQNLFTIADGAQSENGQRSEQEGISSPKKIPNFENIILPKHNLFELTWKIAETQTSWLVYIWWMQSILVGRCYVVKSQNVYKLFLKKCWTKRDKKKSERTNNFNKSQIDVRRQILKMETQTFAQ